MKRRIVWINAGLALLLVAVGAGAYFWLFAPKSEVATSGRTVSVQKGNVSETVTATGTVETAGTLELSFSTAGTLDAVKVEQGDTVKADQKLATLDDSAAQASVTSAQSSYVQAVNSAKSSSLTLAQAQQAVKDAEASAKLNKTGYEQAVEDAPASISVLPREELEKRSYRDITDALKDVPGVVVTGGASSSDISIRGMSSAYTLILIDGKRQNSRETRPNSDNAGIEQGWLPPLQAIERIEVIRGPMSSLYGSEAMGGVINIITRKVHKEWTGSVRAEGTFQEDRDSGDIHQGSVYLAGPIQEDRLGLQFYGQQVRRQEDEILNGFNRQDTRSGTLKLTLTPNADHDLVAEVGRTLQTRTATPGKTVARENCARGACTPNVLSESKYARDLYSLRHAGRWGWAATARTPVPNGCWPPNPLP